MDMNGTSNRSLAAAIAFAALVYFLTNLHKAEGHGGGRGVGAVFIYNTVTGSARVCYQRCEDADKAREPATTQ
jgi:hypothetical protein